MTIARTDIESQLIRIVQELLTELGLTHSRRNIGLQFSLERHLGLDSISRAELASRIEKFFSIRLPDNLMTKAETLADIVMALCRQGAAALSKTELRAVTLHDEVSLTDPSQAQTLLEALILHAEATPNKVHIYFQDDDGKDENITYQQLLTNGQRIAHNLIQRGLERGSTIAIMQPTSPHFFYSFIGVLLAGCVPVPIYPPARAHQLEEYALKEAKILSSAEVRLLITFQEAKLLSRVLQPFVSSLQAVVTVPELLNSQATAPLHYGSTDDLALIQYTSGSTSLPKGVALTHRNLLENIRAFCTAIKITRQDVIVSWLPLYHDLGLIGNWLGSLYCGIPVISFSPLVFLNRPEKWLWAMHYHRGTVTAGPNFAYELCVKKIDTAMLEGLDLSSWRLAINGAETIYPQTLERFTEKFSPYGFKRGTFLPVFGLAENALGLTTPPVGREPWVDSIDRHIYETEHRAAPVTDTHNALQFVSCGSPLPDCHVRIVDDHNQLLPERHIGRLQFHSPSTMQGYFNNPEATVEARHGIWVDSGDFAYEAKGEFFITGRRKDLIIKAGRNLFPSEIESLVSEIPGVRAGCVIAFSLQDTEKGTEQLIVVAEVQAKSSQSELMAMINEKLNRSLQISADKIVLVAPRTIPKTSSGKLQRSACKTMYLNNQLDKKSLPPWVQFIKIGLRSTLLKLKNTASKLLKILYTAYIAILFGPMLVLVWSLAVIVPPKIAAWIFQQWNRLLCRMSFCPITITGREHLYQKGPMIFVANHASYVDIVLLTSLLPLGTRFVAKKSLFRVPFLKTFLHKLGHISVDKNDVSKSVDDTKHIEQALANGESVLIFPEGTFSYAAGLRPFKLGAFKIAAEMKVPVCPISINGTRQVMRGNEFLMMIHPVNATISAPLSADAESWEAVVALKNRARAEIVAHCGEASLDFIVAGRSAAKKKATS